MTMFPNPEPHPTGAEPAKYIEAHHAAEPADRPVARIERRDVPTAHLDTQTPAQHHPLGGGVHHRARREPPRRPPRRARHHQRPPLPDQRHRRRQIGIAMRFVVVGGGGLVGSTLVATLRARGHEAVPASAATGVDALNRARSPRRPPIELNVRALAAGGATT